MITPDNEHHETARPPARAWATFMCLASMSACNAESHLLRLPLDAAVADVPSIEMELLDDGLAYDAPIAVDGAASCDAAVVVPTSFTPADESTDVSLDHAVMVGFSGALAAGSVSSENVLLLAPHARSGVDATVSYEIEHRRIVIAPRFILAGGSTYQFRATGLISICGEALPEVTFTFETKRVAWDLREEFSLFGVLTLRVQSGHVRMLDSLLRPVHETLIFASGEDFVLGTPDNKVLYEREMGYSLDGRSTITYLAGVDTVFGTEDDVIDGVVDIDDDPATSFWRFASRSMGPDGLWLTADDGYTRLGQVRYDDHGNVEAEEYYWDAGSDGMPFTTDDPIEYFWLYRELTATETEARRYGTSAGSDSIWRTPDDHVDAIRLITLDPYHRPIADRSLETGADGVYFTDDDTIGSAWLTTYESTTGALHEKRRTREREPVEMWFTREHTFDLLYLYLYDAEYDLTEFRAHQPGPDFVAGTADDELEFRYRYVPAG
ncbi:MAG: Ig-like domain-containing protein [Sandaracinaceae bacterium]|nr:Ig-like domain-containing protein [Sandaracinaceae bacterium]